MSDCPYLSPSGLCFSKPFLNLNIAFQTLSKKKRSEVLFSIFANLINAFLYQGILLYCWGLLAGSLCSQCLPSTCQILLTPARRWERESSGPELHLLSWLALYLSFTMLAIPRLMMDNFLITETLELLKVLSLSQFSWPACCDHGQLRVNIRILCQIDFD